MKNIWIRLLLATCALVIAPSLLAEPVVVAHKGLAGQNLDAESVKAVLLGKKVTVGSTRVVIVIAKTSAAQEQLLKDTVAMTTSQFQNYWRRLFMTGGGSAPKIVEDEAEACKLAADTPGAVTIADAGKAGDLAILSPRK